MAVRNRKVADSISEEIASIAESSMETWRKPVESVTESVSSTTFAAFDAINGPIIRAMDQNRVIFQKMLHAMQEESLRFVNRRLEHTGRAIESTRECQGVAGLVSVQQEYMIEFARDFAEQTRRFADLVRELADDGTSAWAAASSAVSEPLRRPMHQADIHGEETRSAAE